MTYKERLDAVMAKRKHFTFNQVARRMKANGVKRGYSKDNLIKVLVKKDYQNEDVLKAAEEVLKLDSQFDEPKPIGLKTKAEILAEGLTTLSNMVVEKAA